MLRNRNFMLVSLTGGPSNTLVHFCGQRKEKEYLACIFLRKKLRSANDNEGNSSNFVSLHYLEARSTSYEFQLGMSQECAESEFLGERSLVAIQKGYNPDALTF